MTTKFPEISIQADVTDGHQVKMLTAKKSLLPVFIQTISLLIRYVVCSNKLFHKGQKTKLAHRKIIHIDRFIL